MRRPLLALCALLTASALTGAAAQEPGAADLGEVRWAGPLVRVREGTGREQPLRARDVLRAGQRIRTGRGSGVLLRFDRDGALLLRESTRIALDPPERDGLVATIHLSAGAFFLAHDPSAPYSAKAVEVRTRTASIRLTGGTFLLVQVEPDETTAVTVLEGRVEAASAGRIPTLARGTLTRFALGKPPKSFRTDLGRLTLLTATLGRLASAGTLESELQDATLLLVDPGF